MYQLLLFITACSTVLSVGSSGSQIVSLYNSIAQGDPVLNKIVTDVARVERELLARLTKPGMAASVSREEYSRLFGANAQKKIHITKCPEMPKKKLVGKSRATVGKSFVECKLCCIIFFLQYISVFVQIFINFRLYSNTIQ